MSADETQKGGDFHGEVHESNRKIWRTGTGVIGETRPTRNRNLRAMAIMAEPKDVFVRLRSTVVVSVRSDGVLCLANAVRLCIPWAELRHPPPQALKAQAVVDMVVTEPFAREHHLI
jgi:hypothetical protein